MGSIEVVMHAEAAEWMRLMTSLAPLTAFLVVVFVGLLLLSTTPSPAASGRRAEWWSRAEWAIDMALDDKPERRKTGLALLEQLSRDRFVGKEDTQLATQVRALLLDKP